MWAKVSALSRWLETESATFGTERKRWDRPFLIGDAGMGLDDDLPYYEPIEARHEGLSWGARAGEVLTCLIAEPT